jgi:hypothetical protein
MANYERILATEILSAVIFSSQDILFPLVIFA